MLATNKIQATKLKILLNLIDNNNNINIILNLCDQLDKNINTKNIKFNLNNFINLINQETLQDVLCNLCKNGKLIQVKYFYNKLITNETCFNFNFNNEVLFRKACSSGNLILVKFLMNESNKIKQIDINAWYDNAFKRACKHNHVDIIKYLYCLSLKINKPININSGSNYCFRMACKNDNLFIVKFLYKASLKYNAIININVLQDEAFKYATENNNYEMCKYLWEISKKHKMTIDIKRDSNQIFINACSKNNIKIVDLIMKMLPNYYYVVITDNKISEYGLLTDVRKSLNMLQNAKTKTTNPCSVLGIKKIIKKETNDNSCNICYSTIQDIQNINNNNKLINLSCNHINCLECLLILYNLQFEDENYYVNDYNNYDEKMKCFKSNYNFECTYCKKLSNWKDCTIIKN